MDTKKYIIESGESFSIYLSNNFEYVKDDPKKEIEYLLRQFAGGLKREEWNKYRNIAYTNLVIKPFFNKVEIPFNNKHMIEYIEKHIPK